MEKQKKSIGGALLVILLLIVTVASLVLATYAWARYTAGGTNEGVAQVARWDVKVTPGGEFVGTYDYVIADRVAPGTSGNLTSTVKVTADNEVGVDYKVTLTGITVEYADTAPTEGRPATPTIPDNMIFTDALGNEYKAGAGLVEDTEIAHGYIAPKTANSTAVTVLSWDWPYKTTPASGSTQEAEDAEDTEDGKYPVKITVNYKVEAWQVDPNGPSQYKNVTP